MSLPTIERAGCHDNCYIVGDYIEIVESEMSQGNFMVDCNDCGTCVRSVESFSVALSTALDHYAQHLTHSTD